MTQRELLRKITVWNKRLGLQAWTIDIYISRTSEEMDADAEIKPSRNYNTADLHIATNFKDWTDEHTEKVVVHELTHLIFEGLHSVAQEVADNALGHEAAGAASAWLTAEDERATVHLTKVLIRAFGPA